MKTVSVFSWNPRRPVAASVLGKRIRGLARTNNFGDLLGPLLAAQIASPAPVRVIHGPRPQKLLTIGSVLHYARDSDCVWGSGVNGKVAINMHRFSNLDVRAVRGPLTRAFLQDRGIAVPEVFGDPGLLTPVLFPKLRDRALDKKFDLTIVPNLNDLPNFAGYDHVLDPTQAMDTCLERIAMSRFVVGSSLHAIVVAESLGIPARIVSSPNESEFKYRDYYEGTGRTDVDFAPSIASALAMGGVAPAVFDPSRLLDAFPIDLWGLSRSEALQ